MIIQLEKNIQQTQKESVVNKLKDLKYKTVEVNTQFADYLVGTGKKVFDIRGIGSLEGIKDIHVVSDDYKLVSGKWKVQKTQIDLGNGVKIGNGD